MLLVALSTSLLSSAIAVVVRLMMRRKTWHSPRTVLPRSRRKLNLMINLTANRVPVLDLGNKTVAHR